MDGRSQPGVSGYGCGSRVPMEFERYAAALVAQALDDIDEHRLTIEQALAIVARSAYDAGWEEGQSREQA